MQLDIRKPGGGKTGAAIMWVLENPARRLLIVFGISEKNRLCKLNRLLPESCICEYQDFLTNKHKYKAKELWIDNADMVLQRIFSGNDVFLEGVSMTSALPPSEIKTTAL